MTEVMKRHKSWTAIVTSSVVDDVNVDDVDAIVVNAFEVVESWSSSSNCDAGTDVNFQMNRKYSSLTWMEILTRNFDNNKTNKTNKYTCKQIVPLTILHSLA